MTTIKQPFVPFNNFSIFYSFFLFFDFQNPYVTSEPFTPYAFSYTILDENTGLTHAREEEGNEHGVVTGSYEVLEPNCRVRKVEYRYLREDRKF